MADAVKPDRSSAILQDLQANLRAANVPLVVSTLARVGDEKLVEKFLTENLSITSKGPHALQSQMYVACFWGFKDIVKALIDQGVQLDKQNKGTGWTPLHAAAFQEHGPIVMLLLQNGADPEIPDDDGRTAKDFASASEKIWMHFAALRLKRTPKVKLLQMGVLKKISLDPSRPNSSTQSTSQSTGYRLAFESRPDSGYAFNEDPVSLSAAVNGDVLADDVSTSSNQRQQPQFSLWK